MWNRNKLDLQEAITIDVDGWDTVHTEVQSALLEWIFEDRKHSPRTKADYKLRKRRRDLDLKGAKP